MFRNKTLTEYASDVCKFTDSDQSWLFDMSNKAHLIWENQMSSGALTGTAADLCSIRAVAPVTKTDGGAAPAAAAGVDDEFKQTVLNYINGNGANQGTKAR